MNIGRVIKHPLSVAAIALLVLPHVVVGGFGFTYGIATEIALFALVGIGFNLLLGYTGLLSFGHGMFFGFAAYATALVQLKWFPGSFVLPLVTAIIFTALLGVVAGSLILRRRGVYFSLLTLAFTTLTFYIAFRWTSFTGGENGLSGIVRGNLPGLDLDSQTTFYYLVAVIAMLVAWIGWRVVHSPLGSVLEAVRENETRARCLGYPVQRYKLAAFVISAALTGLGGALMCYLKLFVSAELTHPTFSGEILAMSIFGGIGHFLGPPLGAFIYAVFRETLSGYTSAWQFWFGLLFMGFILFSPSGLIGIGERVLAPFIRKKSVSGAMDARVVTEGVAAPDFLCKHPHYEDAILRLRGVSKQFDAFIAVDNVDFELRDRTLHALIGPNGAGKTTLFNTVAGMFPPDGGTIRLAGQTITGLGSDRIAMRGLSRSFQITNLFPKLTVAENLRLACQAFDEKRFSAWRSSRSLVRVNEEVAQLLKFLGLEGVDQAIVSDLSYGGQRLLEIGLALASRPRVILLDEPLAGLAAAERERIGKLIRSLTRHMAVLLVEHDIDRVFELADHITVMNEGRILVEGDAELVRGHPEVQRIYIGSGKALQSARKPVDRPDDASPLLRLEGINSYYGKSHILRDVSLQVHNKEVTALLGRNGAGKSSTLKSILGIVIPASGRVVFDEEDITGRTPEQVARLGIGLVPQGRRLFAGLTVEENLRLGALARKTGTGVHWDRERIYTYFPKVRDKLHAKADQLSGGEQQMVAIARALSGNIKLLMLDEPFEGLSPVMVEEVFKAIDSLRKEVAILIIEHHLDLVLSLADNAYVLDRGFVSHEGPAEPLLTDLEFRKKVLWL